MVDVSKVTPEQEYIVARHSRMVGKVLDLVEASMPEGNQIEKFKKLIQVPLYDFRNEMLYLNSKGVPDTQDSN
jgi:chemotaxis regulatin CheY-phosphate phosphatase CheZ|tara:strand:- start:8497 stop:8715 length:219 start_codon:yes stop_codon:yes gene_type:complete